MITFKKVRMKNIFSYGNAFTEIELDTAKSTLVVGTNGAGKSSFIEAITFALYGKPYRKVNKSQLVNSVNGKDLLVELEFEVGSSAFMVRRGIKPNKFEIFKDGELVPQDGKTADYQKMLETDILKMTFKSYCQIVVLGTASFTPFMQLEAKDRREFIESLISLGVFSNMNEILKAEVKTNKEAIVENKHSVEVAEIKQKAAQEKRALVEANQEARKAEIKENIKSALAEVETIDKGIATKREAIEAIGYDDAKLTSLSNKIRKLQDYQRTFSSKVSSHEKDKAFFHDNDNCPVCKQAIEDMHKAGIIEDIDSKIGDIQEALDKADEQVRKYKEEMIPLEEALNQVNALEREISDLEVSRRIYAGNLKSLKAELTKEQPVIEEEGEDWEGVLKTLRVERNELLKERDVLSVSALLLKDGGMKAKIIKKYVPMINASVNRYLAAFDFYADFNLDENFNETIRSQYRDVFSYESFSQGEKAKIDISLMLTWRQIAKRRNSVASNLLILDEVFDGSTDSEGVENLKKILNEEDTSYIVISHKVETHDSHFDRVLSARKEQNFTILEEAIAN